MVGSLRVFVAYQDVRRFDSREAFDVVETPATGEVRDNLVVVEAMPDEYFSGDHGRDVTSHC